MKSACKHNQDRVIQTNHGYFCLECGEITGRAVGKKVATPKAQVRPADAKPTVSAPSPLLTHHKTPVLKAPTKLKVTDISA